MTTHVRYIDNEGVQTCAVADLPELLARSDGFTWVDISRVTDDAATLLRETFGTHPMAVRDCEQRNRVPKMHVYTDRILVVLHAPEKGARGHVHFLELDQIVGSNYLITVHGPLNPAVRPRAAERETRAVYERLRAGRLRPTSPLDLSHAIVSTLARNQEQYIEAATSDVWELEQRVTGGHVDDPEAFLHDLFRTRHALLAVRTMGTLSNAIYARLASLSGLAEGGAEGFRDAADQFERVRAVADGEREYLQGVIEFFQTILIVKTTLNAQAQNDTISDLTMASYDQSEHVKKISAWAAIFFAPTLIATIYGMNFEHMPELHWVVGYPAALAVMAAASLILHRVFKRADWL